MSLEAVAGQCVHEFPPEAGATGQGLAVGQQLMNQASRDQAGWTLVIDLRGW